MIYSTLLVVIAAVASFASAQSSGGNGTANFTECCNVDPTTVNANVRLSWCRAQQNTCPTLCAKGATATNGNTCNPDTLVWNCQCLTGTTPNVTDYIQTLPSLECDEWKAQCTASHPNDLVGQNFCQSFVCGMKNGSATGAGASSASTSSAAASGTSSGSTSGSATSAAASATSSKAAAVIGYKAGTGMIGAAMLAVFGLAL